MDAEAVYQHLFTRIPAEHFHSPMLAFEFVQFCRDSLPLFGRNLGVLRTSFPNLFKARSVIPEPEQGLGGLGCAGPLGQCPGMGWGWGAPVPVPSGRRGRAWLGG